MCFCSLFKPSPNPETISKALSFFQDFPQFLFNSATERGLSAAANVTKVVEARRLQFTYRILDMRSDDKWQTTLGVDTLRMSSYLKRKFPFFNPLDCEHLTTMRFCRIPIVCFGGSVSTFFPSVLSSRSSSSLPGWALRSHV